MKVDTKEEVFINDIFSSSKNGNGITLISLIITIIILIILAGITINITIGENGIIEKAINAKELYANAEKEQEKTLNQMETLIKEERENPVEPVVVFDATGSTNEFIGLNPEFNNLDYKKSHIYNWTIDSNRIYAEPLGNKSVLFKNAIPNKGLTTCHIDIMVKSASTGNYNLSDISFAKEIDVNSHTYYSGYGLNDVFKLYCFTDYADINSPSELERTIIDIDITGSDGKDFYMQLHNCDNYVTIYKIWFD